MRHHHLTVSWVCAQAFSTWFLGGIFIPNNNNKYPRDYLKSTAECTMHRLYTNSIPFYVKDISIQGAFLELVPNGSCGDLACLGRKRARGKKQAEWKVRRQKMQDLLSLILTFGIPLRRHYVIIMICIAKHFLPTRDCTVFNSLFISNSSQCNGFCYPLHFTGQKTEAPRD